MNAIELRPIGTVRSAEDSMTGMPPKGSAAVIEVFPEYAAALKGIDENSHLWILSWFHEAKRDVLTASPRRVNPNVPEYGIFALRSPVRPNPIALTLVQLEGVAGDRLFVNGLDAVNGTPVLDIKPYYEQDIVFSPRTPAIVPASRQMRKEIMEKEALAHHRENCTDLRLAIRMGLIVEERWGRLNDDQLSLEVTGSACLADVLQGLTRARLANPQRFLFNPAQGIFSSAWSKKEERIFLTVREKFNPDCLESISDDQLFRIEVTGSMNSRP